MPPWILNSKTKCPIHPKTAIFNRSIQGGLTHQKCYTGVQPGHRVPPLPKQLFCTHYGRGGGVKIMLPNFMWKDQQKMCLVKCQMLQCLSQNPPLCRRMFVLKETTKYQSWWLFLDATASPSMFLRKRCSIKMVKNDLIWHFFNVEKVFQYKNGKTLFTLKYFLMLRKCCTPAASRPHPRPARFK